MVSLFAGLRAIMRGRLQATFHRLARRSRRCKKVRIAVLLARGYSMAVATRAMLFARGSTSFSAHPREDCKAYASSSRQSENRGWVHSARHLAAPRNRMLCPPNELPEEKDTGEQNCVHPCTSADSCFHMRSSVKSLLLPWHEAVIRRVGVR
jgi:hypothetical protein